MRRAAVALAALATLAAGCGKGPAREVRVFAGSSLTDVLGTLAADFERETGTRVLLNLGSSSTLARQIADGAPCDVFLSADGEWADFVEGAGRVEPGTRGDLLTNALVVVGPRRGEEPAFVHRAPGEMGPGGAALWAGDPAAVLRSPALRRIAVADPDHVPAGRYARRGLVALGVWHEVEPRLVRCDTVRAALALVERGEADAGIVYRTDALASRRVSVLDHPPHQLRDFGLRPASLVLPDTEAVYPAMALRGGGGEGRRFLEFLRSSRAREAFRSAGFGIPGEPL